MDSAEREINHKLKIFKYAEEMRNISKACRYFGISRQVYYKWKRSYDEEGEKGLASRKPGPKRSKFRTPEDIEEKVIYLRRTYYFGQLAISSYLSRYHGIVISSSGVYSVLRRYGMNRLPKNCNKRARGTIRYEKQVPGHHVQVDVKFLVFKDDKEGKIKRYQYTAIDDATRIRALKVYERHTQ